MLFTATSIHILVLRTMWININQGVDALSIRIHYSSFAETSTPYARLHSTALLILILAIRGGDSADADIFPPAWSPSAANKCVGLDNDRVPAAASSNAWVITREFG